MKKCIALLMIAALFGCKKDMQEDKSPAQPPGSTEKKWVVTTVAGDGAKDFKEGPALSARFAFPEDVAIAADGTIYVTDVVNARIRKISGGQVSTIAGNGTSGIVNGTGTAAQFKSPYSITSDANGNIYITDENDPRIRKITSSLGVSTYAGLADEGFVDGNADTARFYPGNSIVADPEGNIYVADARNNRIRKISIDGKVTTISGNGTVASPGGITIDRFGNLFVVNRGSYRVIKISPAGDVSVFAGSGTPGNKDGNADEAQFSGDMRDIVIDEQGNLYVSDFDRIRKISPQGIVSTIAGSTAGFADGDGARAQFDYPNGLGIDAQGNIYVADLRNNRIRRISFQ